MTDIPVPTEKSTSAYWNRPAADLIAELNSTPDGLSTPEAQERLQKVGLKEGS